jgi:hypothetical protein
MLRIVFANIRFRTYYEILLLVTWVLSVLMKG